MQQLIRILVEDILTFAYCDEDQIAEDFSAAQLERIAAALGASGDAAIQSFLGAVSDMTNEARASGDNERTEQLELMSSHLGLV